MEKYGFGKRILENQGWKSGKGLGKNESGISEALKPTLKFDKAGIGHNQADDFSFHWWDHVFKKAASNIVVEHSENGVEMKQREDQPDLISTKKWKHKRKAINSKPLTYGVFMKSSALTQDGEVKDKPDSSPEAEEVEDDMFHRSEDDQQLLKACEGRTAHKGARHGLTANGKLMRLEAQENGHLNIHLEKKRKLKNSLDTEKTNKTSDKQSVSHKKKRKKERSNRELGSLQTEVESSNLIDEEGINKALKRNAVVIINDAKEGSTANVALSNGIESGPCLWTNDPNLKPRKKKRKRENKNKEPELNTNHLLVSENTDQNTFNQFEEECTVEIADFQKENPSCHKKKKKKHKRKQT